MGLQNIRLIKIVSIFFICSTFSFVTHSAENEDFWKSYLRTELNLNDFGPDELPEIISPTQDKVLHSPIKDYSFAMDAGKNVTFPKIKCHSEVTRLSLRNSQERKLGELSKRGLHLDELSSSLRSQIRLHIHQLKRYELQGCGYSPLIIESIRTMLKEFDLDDNFLKLYLKELAKNTSTIKDYVQQIHSAKSYEEISLILSTIPYTNFQQSEKNCLHNIGFCKVSLIRIQSQLNILYSEYARSKDDDSSKIGQIIERKQLSYQYQEYIFKKLLTQKPNPIYDFVQEQRKSMDLADLVTQVRLNSIEGNLHREPIGGASARLTINHDSAKSRVVDVPSFVQIKSQRVNGASKAVESLSSTALAVNSLRFDSSAIGNLNFTPSSMALLQSDEVPQIKDSAKLEEKLEEGQEIYEKFESKIRSSFGKNTFRKKKYKPLNETMLDSALKNGLILLNNLSSEIEALREQREDLRKEENIAKRLQAFMDLKTYLQYADESLNEMFRLPLYALDFSEVHAIILTLEQNSNLINLYKSYDADFDLKRHSSSQEEKFIEEELQLDLESRSAWISSIKARAYALFHNSDVVTSRYNAKVLRDNTISQQRFLNHFPKNNTNRSPFMESDLASSLAPKVAVQGSAECVGFALAFDLSQHLENPYIDQLSGRYAYALGHAASLTQDTSLLKNNLREQVSNLSTAVSIRKDHPFYGEFFIGEMSKAIREIGITTDLKAGGTDPFMAIDAAQSLGLKLESSYSSIEAAEEYLELFPENLESIKGASYQATKMLSRYFIKAPDFENRNVYPLSFYQDLIRRKQSLMVTYNSDTSTYLEDWIRVEPTGEMGHALNIVDYGYDLDPFDNRYKAYFVLRDSFNPYVYDAKVDAKSFITTIQSIHTSVGIDKID